MSVSPLLCFENLNIMSGLQLSTVVIQYTMIEHRVLPLTVWTNCQCLTERPLSLKLHWHLNVMIKSSFRMTRVYLQDGWNTRPVYNKDLLCVLAWKHQTLSLPADCWIDYIHTKLTQKVRKCVFGRPFLVMTRLLGSKSCTVGKEQVNQLCYYWKSLLEKKWSFFNNKNKPSTVQSFFLPSTSVFNSKNVIAKRPWTFICHFFTAQVKLTTFKLVKHGEDLISH